MTDVLVALHQSLKWYISMLKEFRCTRRKPYEQGTPGYRNVSARQGHYVRANDSFEAQAKMRDMFPDDIAIGFDIQLWKDENGRLIA